MRKLTAAQHINCVGQGWHDLVAPLVHDCLAHGGQVLQVKEKFAGLRFYYAEADEITNDDEHAFWARFAERVHEAELASFTICEETGKPGRPYSQDLEGKPRWRRTLAPEVAQRLGYGQPERGAP
jgi:hypothetical protein